MKFQNSLISHFQPSQSLYSTWTVGTTHKTTLYSNVYFLYFGHSYYCAGDTNAGPTGPCDPGYYCTNGSTSRVQFGSPKGHYAVKGSAAPTPCPVGTYQESDRAFKCNPCIETAYCDVEGLIVPKTCPRGYYCPSSSVKPSACPRGTYNPNQGKANVTECIQCLPGYYCGAEGLNATSGKCFEGYYCVISSPVPNPVSILIVTLL